MDMASDILALSLPATAGESSALPGGVTSPGRVLPGVGVVNGIMYLTKLHRFLLGFGPDSLVMPPFGTELVGVVDCVEDICEITLSKDVNMLIGTGRVSLRMMIRRRPGAGLQGADDGDGFPCSSASFFRYK